MFRFAEKHPVWFELLLIILAFLAAAVFSFVGGILNVHPELSSSVGRVVVAAVLLLVFRRAFGPDKPLKNLVIVLPALLFAVWNLYYNLSSGASFGGVPFFVEALITAIAPALFEEVLFRGIFLYNLRRSGCGEVKALLLSALVFAAVHLTNLVGQSLAVVALQVGYSLVVGLVFGAIYLKNGSLTQIVAAHFLIDYTNRLYLEPAQSASPLQLCLFSALLIAEAVYAYVVTAREKHRA